MVLRICVHYLHSISIIRNTNDLYLIPVECFHIPGLFLITKKIQMNRVLSEMTDKERERFEQIIDHQVDYDDSTIRFGGSWEGGMEDVSLSDLYSAIKYLISIGVRP